MDGLSLLLLISIILVSTCWIFSGSSLFELEFSISLLFGLWLFNFLLMKHVEAEFKKQEKNKKLKDYDPELIEYPFLNTEKEVW